jgi:hypothetical protein
MGDPETMKDDLLAITAALRMVRGAKWYLIRRVALTAVVIAILVPAVIYLDGKGIFFARPSLHRPSAVPTTVVALRTPPLAHVARTPLRARSTQGDRAQPTSTQQPTAAAYPQETLTTPGVPTGPNDTSLLDKVVPDSLDTISAATATVSELLAAEEDGAAETWCSLAGTLNLAECDRDLSSEWAASDAQSRRDRATLTAIAIGQPSGTATQCTFPIRYGDSSTTVTMVWHGQRWQLSSQDYQHALTDGGILSPLIDNLGFLVGSVL